MVILPGLTTTVHTLPPIFIEELKISTCRAISLFPTCMNTDQRQDLYRELETIPGLKIPHVHLRTDMKDEEIEYLMKRFSSEVFNIHPGKSEHPYIPESEKFLKKIYIENSGEVPEEEELTRYGGLCIDYSHWENGILQENPSYGDFETLAQKFPIGCCHLSAIMLDEKSPWGGFDHHHFRSTADMIFLKKYQNFLPPRWLSMELENSLPQQLEAKAFLENLFWS